MCEVYRSVHGILSQQYWDFKVRRTAELLTASKVLSNRSIMNTLFYCCNRIYYSFENSSFYPVYHAPVQTNRTLFSWGNLQITPSVRFGCFIQQSLIHKIIQKSSRHCAFQSDHICNIIAAVFGADFHRR